MTNMELIQLFGEARGTYVLEAQELRSGEKRKVKSFSTRRIWMLIAAVVTLLALSVTAYAAINARIKLQVVDKHVEMEETVETQVEGQKPLTVGEILTTYYPQRLPDGYRCINGTCEGSALRNLVYKNDAGTEIIFAISTTVDYSDTRLVPPVVTETVEISGHSATLTTSEAGAQNLVWENPEVGFYAALLTEDLQVDLVAMANSVAAGEPLDLNFYYKGGEKWEPWYPQKLPEGYEVAYVSEVNSNGSQQIKYAKEGSDSIEFIISVEDDLSDIGTAPHSPMVWEDVDIGGTPGRKVSIGDHQWLLFWKNQEEGFNMELNTTNPDVNLVEIAKSVASGELLAPMPQYSSPDYTMKLEQSGDTYVGYEPMYPQWLPEGYEESFVSDKAYGEQEIRYENADGDTIRYTLYFRLGQWGRQFSGNGEPEQVDINGRVGYKSGQSIIWTDEERGFAFAIGTTQDVDLLRIARSVAIGEEPTATYAYKTEAALKEQGDYQITNLPEGMFEDGLTGMPLEDGGDCYAYVRRWYFNRVTNAEIYFEYETYVSDELGSPEEMCFRALSGSTHQITDVKISGCAGGFWQDGDTASVAWATGDGQKGTVFFMTSREFTAEELVKFAQSVKKVN